MEGVVWREGSVARESEFFLQIIKKKTIIIILALVVTEIPT